MLEADSTSKAAKPGSTEAKRLLAERIRLGNILEPFRRAKAPRGVALMNTVMSIMRPVPRSGTRLQVEWKREHVVGDVRCIARRHGEASEPVGDARVHLTRLNVG